MTTQASTRPGHRLLAACLALFVAACGGDDGGAGDGGAGGESAVPSELPDAAALPGGRVSLAPAPGVDAPEPDALATRVVERFDLLADADSWTPEAPIIRAQPRAGATGDGPTHEVWLNASERGEVVKLTRKGDLDLTRFNRIRVPARFDGQGSLRAMFRRDGKLLGLSEAVGLVPLDELASTGALPEATVLEVPPAVTAEGRCDTLEIVCSGVYRLLVLAEVELLWQPPEGMLPPADAPDLVRSGEEARRAVALLAGVPLEATVRVPPDGVLRFGRAQPVEALRSTAPAELTVSIDGAEAAAFPLDPLPGADEGWRSEAVDLVAHAGDEVVVRFELTGGAPGAPLGCALSTPTVASAGASVAGGAPTVVLITTDTHRFDHMAFNEAGVDVETPVQDALAARGVVFTDCFAPVNVTNPSHVALMTGESVLVTGVRSNFSRLSDAAPTLAEAFAAEGWLTMAALSTRHLGADRSGLGQGFDRMSWPRGDPRRRAPGTLDDALRWLPDAEGRPLFLWVHVFDAHWPYEPEPRWAERYYGDSDPRDPGLPDPGFELGQVKVELEGVRDPDWQRSLYRAEVSQLDAELARLLDHPRVRRAVTALTADHGESMGEQGVWYDHVGLDPGNLHIPLLLAGPGVPSGERTERPVMHTDLARTLLDLAGLGEVPFPGTTLLEAAPPRPRYAMEGYGSSVSVTHDGLHCILNLEARDLPHVLETREHHQVELYDLTADPRCERDLVDERPADAAKMRTALLRWLQAPPGGGWAEARQDDADFVASLAELGYVAPAGDASGDLWVPDDCAWCQRFED